jgi:tetratricopeptide (TPR) repeat protein
MSDHKNHKKKAEIPEKKAAPKKSDPDIGKKMKYAAFAAVSTTERLIGGLSKIYDNIFVGHQERKVDFDKEQALKCFEQKDYKNAICYFNSYIEGGSDIDAEVFFLLAKSHVSLEEYEEAKEYFKKAMELDSGDPDIVVGLGHCLLNMEDYTEAAPCFKRAIEMAPDEADSYYYLGSCYEKIEQVEEAKSMYKKAIDLSPREGVYYQALGFVYENSGNHKDAIVCFKKAMDLERRQKQCEGGGGDVKNRSQLSQRSEHE